MVHGVNNIPPVPPAGSGDYPIQDEQMAGYLLDINALCQQSGSSYGLFNGVLFKGLDNYSAQLALGTLMRIIGNPDFSQALTREHNAELSSGKLCKEFQSLYSLLETPLVPGGTDTIISLSDNYVSTGSWNDVLQMGQSLGMGSPLDTMIDTFAKGQFPISLLSIYEDGPPPNNKPKQALTFLQNDLQQFYADMTSQPPNLSAALSDLSPVMRLLDAHPDDPNFQLADAMLNWVPFNPNGTLIDSTTGQPITSGGKPITAYSVRQLVDLVNNGTITAAQLTNITPYLENQFNNTAGPTGGTWLHIFGQELANLFQG